MWPLADICPVYGCRRAAWPEVDFWPLPPSPPSYFCTAWSVYILLSIDFFFFTVTRLNKTLLNSTEPTGRFMCEMCLCRWTQLVSCPTSAPHKHPDMCVCLSHAFDCVCIHRSHCGLLAIYHRVCVCVCISLPLASERHSFGFPYSSSITSHTHRGWWWEYLSFSSSTLNLF